MAEVSGWLCYLSGEYGRIEGEIIGRGFAICDWRYLQKSTADVMWILIFRVEKRNGSSNDGRCG